MSRHYSLRGNRLRHSYVIREFRVQGVGNDLPLQFRYASSHLMFLLRVLRILENSQDTEEEHEMGTGVTELKREVIAYSLNSEFPDHITMPQSVAPQRVMA